jgi:hypothetical protein
LSCDAASWVRRGSAAGMSSSAMKRLMYAGIHTRLGSRKYATPSTGYLVHSTAQHSMARHDTASHSAARHSHAWQQTRDSR